MSERPLDTAVIRASMPAYSPDHWTAPNLIRMLCDALDEARAELEWQRTWCDSQFGLMPPSRELNAAFIAAVDALGGTDG